MDKYHALLKSMDQFHGKQNIGSSYKYIVKVSPQTLLICCEKLYKKIQYFIQMKHLILKTTNPTTPSGSMIHHFWINMKEILTSIFHMPIGVMRMQFYCQSLSKPRSLFHIHSRIIYQFPVQFKCWWFLCTNFYNHFLVSNF